MTGAAALDPRGVFAALETHGIRYVLAGSVAAMAYGIDLDPGDLDIVPALDAANLAALGRLLHGVGAKPKFIPGWAAGPSEEQCARWRPEPFDAATLDHRFVTPWGELDVVPHKAATFEALRPRAVMVRAFGHEVPVAHLDDLIAQNEHWDRPRDRARREALRAASARLAAGGVLTPLDLHPAWARPGARWPAPEPTDAP